MIQLYILQPCFIDCKSNIYYTRPYMQGYAQRFGRSSSNARVLQNQHFLSRSRSAQNQLNITQNNLMEKEEKMFTKKAVINYSLEEDYEPANYTRALKYKYSRSYCVKTHDSYKEVQLLEDTKSLKYFGLGPYFYVEFMRRICWIFFIFTMMEGIRIYINFRSSGLANYSISFSSYLITSTLGNFNGNVVSSVDAYIVALVPAAIFFFFVFFYLCWKCHFYSEIEDQEANNFNIKPEKFCIQVSTINQEEEISESGLRKIFELFGPVHEISIIRRHKNKLQYFQELELMQEKIRQIQLQIRFEGNGNVEDLDKLRDQKEKLMRQLQKVRINPKTISAYVHFQYQKSKVECLAFFNKHYLFDTCSHGCARGCCCCCVPELDNQYKISQKYEILIKNEEVPAPEDINWESFELSICSKVMRFILSALIILIFLCLSCAIIGLCTIYVSTRSSNCDSVTIPSSLTQAQASTDPTVKTCYCNANVLTSLTDSSIQSYCSSELQSIYIQQGIQYAIIFTSVLTNFLFGLVVDKLVDCTRPSSQSYSLKIKTLVYTIFLILNTIVLPIVLYSDIFGFKASSYFSFLTLISQGLSKFLSVDTLQFYLDYSQIWYRNVSPIFTNYLIFDTIGVWIMFIFSKCRASHALLQDKQGKILQKTMNGQITAYQFSPYKEYSSFLMIIFMALFLNSGIPVLLPLAWLDLLSRYVTNRSLIQHSSTRVDGLGVAFNQLPHTFLPLLIVAGCVNGCWMLTANSQIYPNGISLNISIDNSLTILVRQLYLPFYIGIALFVLGEYFFYHIIIRFCSCICSCCFQKKMTPHPSYTKTFSQHKKTMNILTSYNIRNNDKMRNALTRMERYISQSRM